MIGQSVAGVSGGINHDGRVWRSVADARWISLWKREHLTVGDESLAEFGVIDLPHASAPFDGECRRGSG
jgi:hypothetical protein